MRVDDHRDRLVGDRPDLVEEALPVVGELGVDEDDPGAGEEDGWPLTGCGV